MGSLNPIFKKLNYKTQQTVYVINAPKSFDFATNEMAKLCEVKDRLPRSKKAEFALIFVYSKAEVAKLATKISDKLADDALLWFAYPKKSSKTYKTDLDRDTSWQPLGALGMEGVRIIAIDADWSALRFRSVDNIKSFKRNDKMILSKQGHQRKANEK